MPFTLNRRSWAALARHLLCCDDHEPDLREPRQSNDDPAYGRRTNIRFDYRINPPLLRSELLDDAGLQSFRPFRGFQGSAVRLPPDVASSLSKRAALWLEALDSANTPPEPQA